MSLGLALFIIGIMVAVFVHELVGVLIVVLGIVFMVKGRG